MHVTLNTINGALEVSALFETPIICDMKFHPNTHVLPPNASTSTYIHPLFIHPSSPALVVKAMLCDEFVALRCGIAIAISLLTLPALHHSHLPDSPCVIHSPLNDHSVIIVRISSCAISPTQTLSLALSFG
jgi:hypothetical protein